MRRLGFVYLTLLAFSFPVAIWCAPPPQNPASLLRLVQTIPLPGVKGRLDHSSVDLNGKRLFVAALDEAQNTVEVVNLKTGKRIASIPGQSKPQGVFYSADFKKLFVANGTDGTCKIFGGTDFKLIASMHLGSDADHVGYDPATKYLYVGAGDAKSGALSIIDTRTNKLVGDIKTDARPGGIKFDGAKSRIYVTLSGIVKVGVVDKQKREVTATWPVSGAEGFVALALDESHHRLFDASRNPPTVAVIDTDSGQQVAQLEGIGGIDDLWYDATHKRIYASGGRGTDVGYVYIYEQKDADHYELTAKMPTSPSAGTSLWVPKFNRLYVAAPASADKEAAILVYEAQR
jgi:DNA-binding beta-propeller fold protein YncE